MGVVSSTFDGYAVDGKQLLHVAPHAGVPVAVCSTSNERAVSTIVRVMLGEDVAKVCQPHGWMPMPIRLKSCHIPLLPATKGIQLLVQKSHTTINASTAVCPSRTGDACVCR